MTLEELEIACAALSDAMTTGHNFEELLEYRGLRHRTSKVQELLRDGQFYVLLDLKRAEQHLEVAYDKLTPHTEYLKEELEQLRQSLHVLLLKMNRDCILRRDCYALLSDFLSEGPEEVPG